MRTLERLRGSLQRVTLAKSYLYAVAIPREIPYAQMRKLRSAWHGEERNAPGPPRSGFRQSLNPIILTMKDSTQDKAIGTAKDLKGKVKEGVGKAVGNPNLRDEGRADQVEGKVQKKVGDVKKVFDK